MKKLFSMTLTSLLILNTLAGCSESQNDVPTVTLPDVSTSTQEQYVAPEITPEETEEVEVDETSSATLDYSTSSAKVIQITPHLVVADEETGRAYSIINHMEEDALAVLTVGAICDMGYVFITYGEESSGNPDSLIPEIAAFMVLPSSQSHDLVGAYMDVLKLDHDLSTYNNVALDLSGITNLSEAEKEALHWSIATELGEDISVFLSTEESLATEGYLEEEDGKFVFKNGVLVKLTGAMEEELSFSFEKELWQGAEDTTIITGSATCEIESGIYSIN